MVETSRTLLRAQAGVRLERIEQLAAKQREVSFRLSTHRETGPRLITDETEAHRAFAREVAASLEDPITLGLIKRGGLDN